MGKCNIWYISSFDWVLQNRNKIFLKNLLTDFPGGPVATTLHSSLMKGALVQSLVGVLDPTCCNWGPVQPTK